MLILEMKKRPKIQWANFPLKKLQKEQSKPIVSENERNNNKCKNHWERKQAT